MPEEEEERREHQETTATRDGFRDFGLEDDLMGGAEASSIKMISH